jgi:hypothetical protein
MARGDTRTADVLRRRWALYRLAGSRFGWLPACSGAPSHYLPQASRQGIVSAQNSILESGWVWVQAHAIERSANVRFGSKADIGARQINIRFTSQTDIAEWRARFEHRYQMIAGF